MNRVMDQTKQCISSILFTVVILGLPAGFVEDLKIDGSFQHEDEDEDLSQTPLNNEDMKNPNIWLAEE